MPVKCEHQAVGGNRKDNHDQRHGRHHADVMDLDAVDDEEAEAALGGEHLADQHAEQR